MFTHDFSACQVCIYVVSFALFFTRSVLVTSHTLEVINLPTISLFFHHIHLYKFKNQQSFSSKEGGCLSSDAGSDPLVTWVGVMSKRQSPYVWFYVLWLTIKLHVSLPGRQVIYPILRTLTRMGHLTVPALYTLLNPFDSTDFFS